MNVQTMQMDPRVAKIHYQDYHRKVLEHREVRRQAIAAKGRELGKEIGRVRLEKTRLEHEDEELMRAYKAMAAGARILNLPSVLKAAGVTSDTFAPKLALARADWKECYFDCPGESAWFHEERNVYNRKPGARMIRVSRECYPRETWNTYWRRENRKPDYPLRAIVPLVPVHLRPARLEEFHILWDAVWTLAPPADPLLLKRVSETIFVVVAQWDLTPLEQAILEGRIG